MSYSEILFDIDDGVALITLNRPRYKNAFTGTIGEELEAAYRRCDEDDAVRVVVLTGSGDAFCAGADMSAGENAFGGHMVDSLDARAVNIPAWQVRKPVIAAVNGHAVGVGLSLAMQCDMRLFSNAGRYGFFQARRGVVVDAYMHWLMPRLAGLDTAAYLLLSARTLNSEDLLAMRLCLKSLPPEEVLPEAMSLAREIAVNCAPLAVAMGKRLLWRSLELDAKASIEQETLLLRHSVKHPDAIEGAMAYIEKRAPKWQSSLSKDWPEDCDDPPG